MSNKQTSLSQQKRKRQNCENEDLTKKYKSPYIIIITIIVLVIYFKLDDYYNFKIYLQKNLINFLL